MVQAATEIWAELSTPAALRRSLDAVPPTLERKTFTLSGTGAEVPLAVIAVTS